MTSVKFSTRKCVGIKWCCHPNLQLFFFSTFIYFQRGRRSGGGSEREVFCLPRAPQIPSFAETEPDPSQKPGAVSGSPKRTWANFCSLHRHVNSKLHWKWKAELSTLMRCQHYRQGFNLLCHRTGPKIILLASLQFSHPFINEKFYWKLHLDNYEFQQIFIILLWNIS